MTGEIFCDHSQQVVGEESGVTQQLWRAAVVERQLGDKMVAQQVCVCSTRQPLCRHIDSH